MSKFSIYYDPDSLKPLCEKSPFKLKKDLKGIDQETLDEIAEEIVNEIYNGLDSRPSAKALYWGKERKAACAKIRVLDIARKEGKSHGYRCVVLVDYKSCCIFLLHLYRHSHGEDKNISTKDKNKLKELVDEYILSLEQ